MQFILKEISFLARSVVIVCQNENGPCPLIALINVLLLQNRTSIHPDKKVISLQELQTLVTDCIFKPIESNGDQDINRSATQQQLIDDVLTLLPSLSEGLNLNVKFFGVMEFENTRELSVFDSVGVRLVHGWVSV